MSTLKLVHSFILSVTVTVKLLSTANQVVCTCSCITLGIRSSLWGEPE